jgi:DNA-binding SARP family transcriptional activator
MPNSVALLTTRLLGGAEIQIAGVPLALNDQKARALFFYLAATGRPHTRDHLATLLWSESSESNARHSLRSGLYHLRQALHARGAEGVLLGKSDLVSLQFGEDACDVTHFRRLLAIGSEGSLAEALPLYRGPFLQGFTLADAPLFDDWVRAEQAELAQDYLQTLQKLASWAEGRQAWSEAIGYLKRIVQVDPLAEEMQRWLLRLYVQTGAIGPALRQYRQFEVQLRQELDLAPSPETQAVIHEALITRRRTTHQTRAFGHLPAHFPQALSFTGRDELLNELLTLSRIAVAGRGIAILVQGEDGMGKSRLLDELAGSLSAGAPPWIVLKGSCSPFDDLLPYGPFLEAFQSADLGDLTDLLTESHNAAPDERGRFFWHVVRALSLLSRNAPLLLAIDDLHWATSSTLQLFGFLATRLRNLPMLLVGTVQRAEAIPALQRLVSNRRSDVHLLSLPPLSLEAVAGLLRSLGISPASVTMLAEWLHERSGGSPFILLEILAQLRAEALLLLVDGGWQLDMGRWLRWRATSTLPQTIHDLLAWRVANLSSDLRYLLEVLAVAEQPLPFALLNDFPGIQAERLLPMLDDLIARRLVTEAPGERFALPHHLLRETLVHHLSHLRQRVIHRQLAEALDRCPALQKDFPLRQIALHAVAGEDAGRARRYGLQVLDDLIQDGAGGETVDFLHHLHDLLAPTASPEELLRLTYALGRLHQLLGHLETAAYWHQQHLEIARAIPDLSAQATAHFEMGELALVSTDHREALSAAEAGLLLCRAFEGPLYGELAARGHRLLGAALAMEGSDLPAAEGHLQKAAAAHRRDDDLGNLCATLFELGNIAAQRGELARALEFYEEAASLASTAHNHYFRALARNNFAYHSLLLGRPDDARRAVAQGEKVAETYELFGAFLHLFSTRGEIHLYLGEWAAATEVFQRGLALAEELGNLERQAGYRAGLALAARGQNDFDRAIALLEEALTLITERGYWHLQTRILLWLAETMRLRRRLSEAESHLETALTMARGQGRVLLLIQGERLRARLLAARNDWAAANALFAQTLEHTISLGFALESARTQVAWGESLLRSPSTAQQGRTLLAEARKTLAARQAHAEVNALRVDRIESPE